MAMRRPIEFLKAIRRFLESAMCHPHPTAGANSVTETIPYRDFERIDIRVGTVVAAKPYPEARKPAIKLWIDFGAEIGVKASG